MCAVCTFAEFVFRSKRFEVSPGLEEDTVCVCPPARYGLGTIRKCQSAFNTCLWTYGGNPPEHGENTYTPRTRSGGGI